MAGTAISFFLRTAANSG